MFRAINLELKCLMQMFELKSKELRTTDNLCQKIQVYLSEIRVNKLMLNPCFQNQ